MKSVKSCVRNNTLPVGPFSPAYALKKLSPEEPSPVRWISSIFPSPVFINPLFFLFPVFPPPSLLPPSSFSLNLYEVINGINKRVTFFCPNEPRGNVSRSFPTASIWMLNGLMAPSVPRDTTEKPRPRPSIPIHTGSVHRYVQNCPAFTIVLLYVSMMNVRISPTSLLLWFLSKI